MTPTNKKLLALLKQNARLSNAELSTMLGISEQEVAAGIKELEASGLNSSCDHISGCFSGAKASK